MSSHASRVWTTRATPWRRANSTWRAKASRWPVPRRVVVVVVETALADAHHHRRRPILPAVGPAGAELGGQQVVEGVHARRWHRGDGARRWPTARRPRPAPPTPAGAGPAPGRPPRPTTPLPCPRTPCGSRRPPTPGRWCRPAGRHGVRPPVRVGRPALRAPELLLEVAVGVEPLDHLVVHRNRRATTCVAGRAERPSPPVARPGTRPSAPASGSRWSLGAPSSPIRRQISWAEAGMAGTTRMATMRSTSSALPEDRVHLGPGVGLPRLGRLELGVGLADEPPGGLQGQIGQPGRPGLGDFLHQRRRTPRPAGCRRPGPARSPRTWSRPPWSPGTGGSPGCWPGRSCSGWRCPRPRTRRRCPAGCPAGGGSGPGPPRTRR